MPILSLLRSNRRPWIAGSLVAGLACLASALAAVSANATSQHERLIGRELAAVHSALKPPIVGLVDKSSQAAYVLRQPFSTVNPAEVAPDAAAFAGIVVNETWAQLEPQPGQFDFAPLRQSLNAVRAYNRAHPGHQLAVKLRLWGGFTAPDWAKTLGGTTPVSFDAPKSSGTTGRWWTRRYRAAWSLFQHRLAASFDSDQLIGAVAVSSCATLTAEPFVQSPNLALHNELFADGWSSSAQESCLMGAFADYSGWRHTPIDYAFNTFSSYIEGKQLGTPQQTFTNQVMTRCADLRRSTGRSCILSNHDLIAAVTATRSGPTYAEIDALYARRPARTPVDFQTGPPDNFGGCQAINVAVAYHAQSVELWPPSLNTRGFKGFGAFPELQLADWAQALRTRTPLTC